MATTYYATTAGGGGNWSSSTSWSTVSDSSATNTGTFPVAGDTAIFDSGFNNTITITGAAACATLTMTGNAGTLAFGSQTLTITGVATLSGAMTSTAGIILVSGGVTLTGNITGTFPQISINANQVWTSNGHTYPGVLYFNASGLTLTASGNLSVTTLNQDVLLGAHSPTFAGAYSFTFANFIINGNGNQVTFPGGQTLNITNSLTLWDSLAIANGGNGITLQSSNSTPINLNYSGPLNNQAIINGIFTHVNALYGSPLYNWLGSASSTSQNIILANVASTNYGVIGLTNTGVWGNGGVAQNSANAMNPDTYCVQLNPSGLADPLYWNFLIPCSSGVPYTLSFYDQISSGFTGKMNVTIYDYNGTSILSGPTAVTLTNDSAYHQYTNASVTPTNTGFSLVQVIASGTTTGSIYIDSVVGI